MCALVGLEAGPLYTIFEDDRVLVMLPRYVRRWGQVMVIPKAHVTSYREVDPAVWAHVNGLVHVAARVVEQVERPRRCYVASIGSNPTSRELLQSSRHLHVHIIPIHRPEDCPADVFSWAEGVYVAEPHEWEALRQRYRCAWEATTGYEG